MNAFHVYTLFLFYFLAQEHAYTFFFLYDLIDMLRQFHDPLLTLHLSINFTSNFKQFHDLNQ
jgi:hypothetical protein